MAENNNRNQSNEQALQQDHTSIGNQQATTQTGAQNNGGTQLKNQDDQYTDDLQRSGDRSSSNRNEER